MKLTVNEMADHYGVTSMTIRAWIRDGNIHYDIEKVIGVKPRMKVDKEDIEKYLASKGARK